MNTAKPTASASKSGTFTPLRHALFRTMWVGSLLSNLGLFVLSVGAAWSMTQMTSSASFVALVQTALMLPIALFAIPAGAIADMFDRRIVAMLALCVSIGGALILTALTYTHNINPVSLLVSCFIVGSGMALLWPAWGSSVSEQVPAATLPAAVALNGFSFNVARSLGPAIGGLIVASAGSIAAFGINAISHIPLLVVLYRWQRKGEPTRLPPETLGRAVISGLRYVGNSPPIRIVIARTLVAALAGGSVAALLPLVARDLVHGDARMFGVLLGCFGAGAVVGALNVGRLRSSFTGERSTRICALAMGLSIALIAESRWSILTGMALLVFGAAWTATMMVFNITVQLSAPRWVAARTLATYQAAVAAGVALGGWGWGLLANTHGVDRALLASAAMMLASPLLGRWLRMPTLAGLQEMTATALADPEMRLPLTARSGPIVVEIEYQVEPAKARLFYAVMQRVQSSRQRNGAYGWSIARDIANPELWTERYHCPTLQDYLRQRNRSTHTERELHARAIEFHIGSEPVRVRRMLERPIGSVRWQDATPDRDVAGNDLIAPQAGGL